jgi:hypothetical protein
MDFLHLDIMARGSELFYIFEEELFGLWAYLIQGCCHVRKPKWERKQRILFVSSLAREDQACLVGGMGQKLSRENRSALTPTTILLTERLCHLTHTYRKVNEQNAKKNRSEDDIPPKEYVCTSLTGEVKKARKKVTLYWLKIHQKAQCVIVPISLATKTAWHARSRSISAGYGRWAFWLAGQ